MKKICFITLLLLTLFVLRSEARITTNVVHDLTIPGQGILPNTLNEHPVYGPFLERHQWYEGDLIGSNASAEGYIIIMGIDIVQTEDPYHNQRFKGVTVDIIESSIDRSFVVDSTVVIDRSGKILGVIEGGAGDISVPEQSIPTASTGDLWFIAIRIDDRQEIGMPPYDALYTEDRSWAKFTVPEGGVEVTPSNPDPDNPDVINAPLITNTITCELRIADIMPLAYDNIHDPVHSAKIPEYPSYQQWQPGEMIRPLYAEEDIEIEYTGTAGEGSAEDILVDETQNWILNSLVGATVYNTTTEDEINRATVVSNTANIIRTDAELAWDEGDGYRVYMLITGENYSYSLHPLEHEVPQVLPWETQTAAIAIACAQRNVTANGTASPNVQNPPEYLSSITLTITAGESGSSGSGGDFNPNYTFRTNPGEHGITLWRDTNDNGRWEPGTDAQINVSYSSSGMFNQTDPFIQEWTITLSPTGETIEDVVDDLFDYFIVIEQNSNYSTAYSPKMGQDYKIWIKPGDVVFGPIAYPVTYAGIDDSLVKPIYNNIYLEDLAQERVDPVEIALTLWK